MEKKSHGVGILPHGFSQTQRFTRDLDRPGEDAHQQGDDERDEEDEEQDLGDARGAGGDATEAQDRGDQSDDEENGSPVKHGESPWFNGGGRVAVLVKTPFGGGGIATTGGNERSCKAAFLGE